MPEGTAPPPGTSEITQTLPAYDPGDLSSGPNGSFEGGAGPRRPATVRGRAFRAIRRHPGRLALVVALLLAGAGVGTWLLSRSSGPDYVLTSATTGTVQQTVSATSTIEAANQATLNFATSGTVASVDVVVGQNVTAGQTLATLDASSLQATVAQDEASVASAQSKLSDDESGQSLTTAEQAVTTAQQQVTLQNQQIAADQTAISNDQTNLADQGTANAISLAQSQNSLSDAQTKLSQDETTLSDEEEDLSAAQSAYVSQSCGNSPTPANCTTAWVGPSGTTYQSGIVGAKSILPGEITTEQTTVTSDNQAVQVDQLSLESTEQKNAQAITTDQQAIATAQQTLANAQVTLQNDEQDVTNDQTTVSEDKGNLGATVESDEASLESAELTLSNAEKNVDNATLTTPIAGTVTAVNVAVGNTAAAGNSTVGTGSSSSSSSSSAASSSSGNSGNTSSGAFQIVSSTAFIASASVSSADVSDIAVGDQVQLVPSGSATTIYGTVSSLGIVATVSSGVATFPVTIAVTGTPAGLYSGMTAQATIIVLQRSGVLTLPSSAVHSVGTASYVYELKNGKEVEHTVGVGAVGTTSTQITSGLKSGTKVVLANLSQSISTGSNSTGSSRFGGFGGFGGLGGGGFTGGGGSFSFRGAGGGA